jgi:hypothetical protein
MLRIGMTKRPMEKQAGGPAGEIRVRRAPDGPPFFDALPPVIPIACDRDLYLAF